MGSSPEVFVRPDGPGPGEAGRAIEVLMSAQGQSVPDIAHLLDCSQERGQAQDDQ
jgi:hypothetical protein